MGLAILFVNILDRQATMGPADMAVVRDERVGDLIRVFLLSGFFRGIGEVDIPVTATGAATPRHRSRDAVWDE